MDAQTRYEKRAYFSGKHFVPLIFHLFSIEGGRGTRGNCPPSRQPSQPGLAPYPAATAHGLTTREGQIVVRCRKQHKGKEKVVRARGKSMHRARTAWCTARTALIFPSMFEVLLRAVGEKKFSCGAVEGGRCSLLVRVRPRRL